MTLAAGARQRPSQLLALEWPDIDLNAKTLRTAAKVIYVKGAGLQRVVIENDPKNPGGTIALPDFAIEMLKRRKATLAARRLASPPDPDRDDIDVTLVFPSKTWTLRDPSNVQHEWQRVREALGATMTQRKYMACGRVHPQVATALDRAVGGSDVE